MSIRSHRRLGLHAVLTAGVLWAGCGSQGNESARPLDCEDLSAASLRGEWLVTAEGEWYGCDRPGDNGKIDLRVEPFRVDIELTPSLTPSVIEVGDEADAFVDRVQMAEVSLSADLPSDVSFEGGGGADCTVNFSIIEKLSNDSELIYNFQGFVQYANQATGNVSGFGPGGCKVRGTFTVDRR